MFLAPNLGFGPAYRDTVKPGPRNVRSAEFRLLVLSSEQEHAERENSGAWWPTLKPRDFI